MMWNFTVKVTEERSSTEVQLRRKEVVERQINEKGLEYWIDE